MNEQWEKFWNDIPVGRENAIDYTGLMVKWNTSERKTRLILHELSLYDNGDNYVLIRSSKNRGFFKTDNPRILQSFRHECLNKGKSIFAPVRKINRVLRNQEDQQFSMINNLKVMRENKNLTQTQVCQAMRSYGFAIDKSLLSKMENGICVPTPQQAVKLAAMYETSVNELINLNDFLQ